MTRLVNIEGIGPIYAGKLEAADIHSQEQLLEACSTPQGRKQLSEQSDVSEHLLLKWANRADLARISGIGEEYADLLEEAGVDTVPELAQRNAKNLFATLTAVNDEKHRVRHLPSKKTVESWIDQAKELPRKIAY